jgi:hypothetical protein
MDKVCLLSRDEEVLFLQNLYFVRLSTYVGSVVVVVVVEISRRTVVIVLMKKEILVSRL